MQVKVGIKWYLKVQGNVQIGTKMDTFSRVNRLASEFESCIVHHFYKQNDTENFDFRCFLYFLACLVNGRNCVRAQCQQKCQHLGCFAAVPG